MQPPQKRRRLASPSSEASTPESSPSSPPTASLVDNASASTWPQFDPTRGGYQSTSPLSSHPTTPRQDSSFDYYDYGIPSAGYDLANLLGDAGSGDSQPTFDDPIDYYLNHDQVNEITQNL
jgi:hypothetical protein